MNKFNIFISVLNWNSTEQTLNCIEMLQQQSYPYKQIVVVDNASQPAHLDFLKKELPKDVLLIESIENNGYASGHILAVEVAKQQKADFIWILNPDVLLQPNTIQLFLDAFQQFGEAIYGTVPLKNLPNQELKDFPIKFHIKFFAQNFKEILFNPFINRNFGELFPTLEPRFVSAISGSSIFLPISVIEKHGFMDCDYFMYSEEIDYCFRLARNGVSCIIVPEAYVIHHDEGTSAQFTNLKNIINYYRLRNQLVRIHRYGSRFDLVRAVLKDIILVVSYPLMFGRNGVGRARFGILAILDGLRGKLGKTFPPEDFLDN